MTEVKHVYCLFTSSTLRKYVMAESVEIIVIQMRAHFLDVVGAHLSKGTQATKR